MGLVAGGGDDHHAVAVGVAQRGDQLGDVRGGDPAGEFEREVDHARAVVDREAHSLGDRGGVAVAFAVEHAHRHDPHPVRQPGEALAVVGRLRDRAGDVGAVAVAVVGEAVVGDEVPPRHELVAVEVGRHAKAPAVGVGDAGVEHRHHHPPPSGGVVGDQVLPRPGGFDAEFAGEVPLQFAPPPGRFRQAGVVGEGFAGRRGGRGALRMRRRAPAPTADAPALVALARDVVARGAAASRAASSAAEAAACERGSMAAWAM